MWIQASGILGQWLSQELVRKLGRLFENYSKVVIPESRSKHGRFAKLLVEVDLSKPLVRGTTLCCNGEACWVEFKYKNLPMFCFYCGMIVHGERRCGKKEMTLKIRIARENFGSGLEQQIEGVIIKIRNEGGRQGTEVVSQRLSKIQNVEQGHSVSKIGLQDGTKVNNAGCGLRESLENSLTSNVSEVRITKENENKIGEGQREIEKGADYLQLVPITIVELNAQEAEGGQLDTSSKKEEGSSRGTLIELDQNKGGLLGCALKPGSLDHERGELR